MVIEKDEEYDVDITCPNCGSSNIIVEMCGSFYTFGRCKKCGHKVENTCFSMFD